MLRVQTSMGRPTKPIVLNEEERSNLQEWARRPKTAQRLALRARILLGCAAGMKSRKVARQLRITDAYVLRRCGDSDGITCLHIELGQAVIQQHASLPHAIMAA